MTLRACLLRICFLLVISVFTPGSGYGQAKLDTEFWDMDYGLSNRMVRLAARGPEGFLWLVSLDLEMYDGHRFTRFSRYDEQHYLPISQIKNAVKLGDSTLVLSNDRDLIKFNMYTRKSSPMHLPKGIASPDIRISKMVQRDHNPDLILVTQDKEHSYIHLVDRHWNRLLTQQIDLETQIRTAFFTNGPSGTLWMRPQKEDHILKITASGVDTIPFDFTGFEKNSASHPLYHPQYGLLVIKNNGLIYRLDEQQKSWELIMDQAVERSDLISVHIEHSGKVWLVFLDRVMIVDIGERSKMLFQQSLLKSRSNIQVHHIFEDNEQNTWLSSEVGLAKVREHLNPFLSALKSEEVNNQFREIFPLENGIGVRLIGKRRLISRLDYHSDQRVDTTVLYSEIPATGRFLRYQHYLLNTQLHGNKLCFYDLRKQNIQTVDLPVPISQTFFNQAIVEGDEFHYINRDGDITVYDLKTGGYHTVILEGKELFQPGFCRVLLLNNGRYIHGSNYDGLVIHDANTGALLQHFSSDNYPEMSCDFINCIQMDGPDSLWLGTLGGGMVFIDLRTEKVKSYTVNDGLSNNLVASITEDDLNNLWVGTYHQLNRFDKETEQFYAYSTADGLPHNEFNYLSAYKAPDGNLFLGTLNGIMRFNPRDLLDRDPLPQVSITGIWKYNRKTNKATLLDRGLDRLESVQVSPFDNYIQFDLAVPSFANSGNYHYWVKLEGMDDQWQDLGSESHIRYQKLPPGNYTLNLKAIESTGAESEQIRQVLIRVQQVFYRSWWFILSMIAFLVFLLVTFYKYRIKLLRKESETRIRIAQDLHDEIGSSMTRISLQLQVLETGLSGHSKGAMQKLGKVVDQSINKLRDLVWAVDKSSDQWKNVLERMEDYAFDTLLPKSITFQLRGESIDREKVLPPDDKKNLYLIFKESINNIARHSNAKRVNATICNERSGFVMIIEDDGQPTGPTGMGNGLKNISMRAENMGGNVSFGFVESVGFRVVLNISHPL